MTNDDDAPVRPSDREGADDPPSEGEVARGTAPRRKKRVRRRDAAGADPGASPLAVVGAPREVAIDDAAVIAVRRQLLVAAGAAAAGVAMVGTGPSDVGMWIAIVGGIGLVASIHRLGRLGPPALPGSGGGGPPAAATGPERGA